MLALILKFSVIIGQEARLCQGYYWAEDKANLMLKDFASKYNDSDSWQKRADSIKKGILGGLQWEKMASFKMTYGP